MQEMELEKSIKLLEDQDLLSERNPMITTDSNHRYAQMLHHDEDQEDPNNKDEASCQTKTKSVFCTFKDYVFPLTLLLSCCPNFSFLNAFYLALGLLYLSLLQFFILKINKFKLIAEITALVYSSLCLIFKITVVSLKVSYTDSLKKLFLNLGVTALQNKGDSALYVITFLGDSCVVAISVLSMLITLCCAPPSIQRRHPISPLQSQSYSTAILWLLVINGIFSTSFNLSFSSLAIAFLLHLSLFLWAIIDDVRTGLFLGVYIIILLIYLAQIVLIHVMNIECFLYFFKDNLKYFLAYCGAIQINGAIPKSPQDQLPRQFRAVMSYVFITTGIILLFIAFKALSMPLSIINEIELEEEGKGEKKKRNIYLILLRKFAEYLISPYFILHFCRVGLIVWVYVYRNYESIPLLIWLCLSFLLLKIEKLFFVSKYLIYPLLVLVSYLFQLTNIPFLYAVASSEAERIKNEHFGLYIYHYEVIENVLIQTVIVFFVLLIKAIVTSQKLRIDLNKTKDDELSLLVEKEDVFIDEDIEKKTRDFSFPTLLLKFILGNIDKITLVIMYFIAIEKVNVTHCLLIILFMIQLIYPNAIIKICYGVMIFIQLIFCGEYVFDLLKVFLPPDDVDIFDLIKIFISYSQEVKATSLELLLFLAVYCFYIQYQNYNYALYKNIVLRSNYTCEGYLNEKFAKHPFLLGFSLGFVHFVLELYVWVLVVFGFFFLCFFEINLFFNVKFALFLVLCFQFLVTIQSKGKKRYSTCVHWIFMMYCMVNTLLVYFYQFGDLAFFKESFEKFIRLFIYNRKLRENLPVIGVQIYEVSKLKVKLLPHLAMNFLSVLFYWEIQRISSNLTEQRNNKKLMKQLEDGSVKLPLSLKKSDILGLQAKAKEDKSKAKGKEDKGNEKAPVIDNVDFQDEPKDLELDESTVKDNNKKTMFFLKAQYYLYEAITLFTKIYWLLIFLSIFIIFTTYSLSLSMIIYLIIFGFSFIGMYRDPIRSIGNFLKTRSFYISKLIRHNLIEVPKFKHNMKYHHKITFRIVLSFSIIYILLTYFCAVLDISQNGCKSPLWDCNMGYYPIIPEEKEDYFQAVSYLFGIYVNVRRASFFSSIWVHIFLIAVVSLDMYIHKLHNFVSSRSVELNKVLKKLEFEIENTEGAEKDFLGRESLNKPNESFGSGRRSFGDSFSQMVKSRKVVGEVLIEDFLSMFKNANSLKARKKKRLKKTNTKIVFMKIIKAVFEEVILLIIIFTSISKLSLWSFIYMGFLLFVKLTSKKTINTFYSLLIVMVISLIIQAGLYLSNLSSDIAPNPDKLCLMLLEKNLSLPWYSFHYLINDAWGFFLGMGVNTIQTKSLFLDFITIVILCVYLDAFSYSIYQEVDNIGNVSTKSCKINYSVLCTKPSLRPIINSLTEEEYFTIKNNFFKTFEIQLCSYMDLKKYMDYGQSDKEVKPAKEDSISSLAKMLYLSMHNIVLTIIIVLSIMASGLVSAIYISFSLLYLLDSTSIIKGTRSGYPKGIKTYMRYLIIIDIIIQLLIQTPFNIYFSSTFTVVLKTIGLNQIMQFDDPNKSSFFQKKSNELFIVNVKAVTYFIMSLQVYIYSTKAFQEFYFNYVLKKNSQIRKRALINSFLFNNKRIEKMNEAIDKRLLVMKEMSRLEQTLTLWNSQLSNLNAPREALPEEEREREEKEKASKETIREEIRAHMLSGSLIRSWKWIHRHNTNYSFTEKKEKAEFEMSIIKGKTMTPISIEKAVDTFVSQLDVSLDKEEIIKVIDDYLQNERMKEVRMKKDMDEVEEDQKDETKPTQKNNKEVGIEEQINTGTIGEIDLKEGSDDDEEEIQIASKVIQNPIEEAPPLNQTQPESKQDQIEKIQTLLRSNIKRKHFKASFALKKIIENYFIYLLDNSHNICFIIMIIHHMVNGSLISLFYPLAVFGMGLLDDPRPSKLFWRIVLAYSTVILIIKFVIQFYFIQTIPFLKSIFSSLTHWKIGLTNYETTFSAEFFLYIFLDALILFIILLQEYILITKGIWDKNEASIESIKEAHERINKANLNRSLCNDIQSFNNEYLLQREDGSNDKIVEMIRKTVQKSMSAYWKGLFPRVRNEKPGDNYYIFYTIPLMLIIIYLIVFYTNMEQDKVNGFTNIEDVTKNAIKQFSGVMVIFVVVHVIVAVIDRVIFIRQNRNELTFEYFFFDKETGKALPKKEVKRIRAEVERQRKWHLRRETFEIPIEELEELRQNYNVMVIQNEKLNLPLIAKYVLHWATLVFSHLFVFFFLPMKGNYNLQNSIYCESEGITCNDFSKNVFSIVFYVIYLFYLFFSAMQIRSGLLDLREKSLLKTTYSSINGIIFKTIKAIPFLYELKLSIDWTFTSTCLDLFQWNKFEKIYDVLYTTTCAMKYVQANPVGNKITKFWKALMGGSLFTVILLILVIPLFLFSTLNPTNEINKVTGARSSLSIMFQDKDGMNSSYILFENNQAEVVNNLQKNSSTWKEGNYSLISQTKNFPENQIQIVRMRNTSDSMWNLATPYKEKIVYNLDRLYLGSIKTIYFGYDYTFGRSNPPESKESTKHYEYPFYDSEKKVYGDTYMLKRLIDSCENGIIGLDAFYKPGLRLYSTPHPKLIPESPFHNASLLYFCNKETKASYFSLVDGFRFDLKNFKGLEFHVFSDKVSSATGSYSIITFFTTYILVAGMYLGNFFAGEAERVILTEMPESEKLVHLCEGIQISRYRHQLEKEEHLFYVLIEFMRSPEYLRLLTKSSLNKFKERKEKLNKPIEEAQQANEEPEDQEDDKEVEDSKSKHSTSEENVNV